ncbi:hypothetical protein Pmar_PMAR001173, partial [Perkinsus marinus ATCC 50983]
CFQDWSVEPEDTPQPVAADACGQSGARDTAATEMRRTQPDSESVSVSLGSPSSEPSTPEEVER